MILYPCALAVFLLSSAPQNSHAFSASSLTVPRSSGGRATPPRFHMSAVEDVTTTHAGSAIKEIGDASSSSVAEIEVDVPTSGQKSVGIAERLANSGVASAAAMATAAVNAAVAMKTLEAPSVEKSYISLDGGATGTDEDGLPLRYDTELISQYWAKERGALNARWGVFVGRVVPFLTKLTTLFITEGEIGEQHIPALSRQARLDLQFLGPTFIKAGQMMSVRPDVLPQATLDELTILQDSVEAFPTAEAVAQIERELGGPLGQFFTSISEEPVAAASLAQVYLATLNDGKDTRVAVKVQRPNVLTTVSKDLYVLRRAAEVWQGLVERFAPQQRTNYVALLNEWAIGFYTELDFTNEAKNQQRLRQSFIDNNIQGIMVPDVYEELCTRRILVSEWVDGKKLSTCPPEKIKEVTKVAQEAFLMQLFQTGFFHADPHPGNILLLDEPTEDGYEVALIDCGLMANINEEDRDIMISAVIHLANKDYPSLVDDFMNLKILPPDSDRAAIIPLMDKALSPYVKGGGAKKYEAELKKLYDMKEGDVGSQVGGFQAMTQDALTVLNDIPFSIPPYFAILGRAIVTLEGVALVGDPDYGIIMESYPYIARQLVSSERPQIQQALQQVLYGLESGEGAGIKFTRLLSLLNNAAGGTTSRQEGGAFVDLDGIPEDGLDAKSGLKFLLSDRAEGLRSLLVAELDGVADVLLRSSVRRGAEEALRALTPPKPPSLPFFGDVLPAFAPKLDTIPLPFLLPGADGDAAAPSVGLLTYAEFVDKIAPRLDRDEELFGISLADGAKEFLGEDVGRLLSGEGEFGTDTARMLLSAAQNGGLGRSDLLGEGVVGQVVEVLTDLLDRILPQSDSDVVRTMYEELEDKEQERLQEIVEGLTERGLKRLVERLADVPRVLG
mmetsp:Transcript_35916/g.83770  ORF Transcript_35916/g.83770 Transcript_35916/m.83770 type:complete len:900 (-) Transcript_35916:37-2736(-)